jgi:hypothetical protein
VKKQETDFLRGYATTFSAGRYGGSVNCEGLFGEDLKNKQMDTSAPLGAWNVGSQCMGETIPKETNYLNLDRDKKDE